MEVKRRVPAVGQICRLNVIIIRDDIYTLPLSGTDTNILMSHIVGRNEVSPKNFSETISILNDI